MKKIYKILIACGVALFVALGALFLVFNSSVAPLTSESNEITFNIPENKKEEIKVEFPGYFKYISRGFENKSDVMNDREVSSTKCYLCHKNLKKKIRWYSPNSKNY